MLDVARQEVATHFIKYVNIPNQETAVQSDPVGLQYWRMILPALERNCRTDTEVVQ